MLTEDQYLDQTPDLVARVRKMRETARKKMDHFTKVSDYDVVRQVGRKTSENGADSESSDKHTPDMPGSSANAIANRGADRRPQRLSAEKSSRRKRNHPGEKDETRSSI